MAKKSKIKKAEIFENNAKKAIKGSVHLPDKDIAKKILLKSKIR